MTNTSPILGKFITIEGQDGAGKTTNLAFICEYLQQQGIELIVTREPGGTELGENLRELLLCKDITISAKTELLLMFSARCQHVEEVIVPALNTGKWVVCDRFTDATYAYQGGGHGINSATIEEVEQVCLGGFKPDLTLLLDVDVDIGQSRSEQRRLSDDVGQLDRFERQKVEFKQRVRDAYLQRCEKDSFRMKRVNASQSLGDVQHNIADHLTTFLKQ